MALCRDSADGAKRLIAALPPSIGSRWLVLGILHGGVPLAAEIVRHLGEQLDVMVVRKVGAPGNPEVVLAAVTAAGGRYDNVSLRDALGLASEDVTPLTSAPRTEAMRRAALFAQARSPVPVRGRNVFLVDDGVATGATLITALETVRAAGALAVFVAVPVAIGTSLAHVRGLGAQVVCPCPAVDLYAVGQAYESFDQVEDKEVDRLLRASLQSVQHLS